MKAQGGRTMTGVVQDSTGRSIIAATVKLVSGKDSLFTRTDIDGNFRLRNVQATQFVISVSSLGYHNFSQRFTFREGASTLKIGPLRLKAQSKLLNEVVVSGTAPVTIKEDTVEYRASDYRVRENSVVEDVIRKLPGVEVDKDGNVTTQGKSITRVRVNGKDFFDGDLKTATQNLPAEVIEKIQIVDDYGDQANVSGIKDGDPEKILNITISPSKNKGMIANFAVGGGNDARKDASSVVKNEGRYLATGMAQVLNNDQQLAVLLNLNNTNASLFDFTGGGNQRGGRFRMGAGGGPGGGMGGGGFGGGSGAGITDTKAGGFNYRDELGKKVSIYGSYSFQDRNTDLLQNSLNQTSSSGVEVSTVSRSSSNTDAVSHRFNFNLEYRIDSLNYLKVSPSLNYSRNSSEGLTNSVITEFSRQDQGTVSSTHSKAPSIGGDLLYNHRFVKRGRNLSMSLSLNKSSSKNDQDIRDDFRFYSNDNLAVFTDSVSNRLIGTESDRSGTEANLVYSEPLGVYSRIDFSYNYSRTSYDNTRITQLGSEGAYVPADSLSNIFDYSFTTNRFGLSYRYDRQKLYNFSIGFAAQPTLLDGRSETNHVGVHRTGFNWVPNARFVYNFARSRALTINYTGRSNEPSYTQIQPVVDLSNPQRPVVGNPDLKASFDQNLNIRYNNFDPAKGTFFIIGAMGTFSSNKIINNIVRLRQPVISGGRTTYNLIQETRYLNADGYYSGRGFYAWSKPFSERKYTLRLNGSVSYTNDVSYADNQKNIGKTWSASQGFRFQINPNENIDITPGASYTRSWVDYTIPTSFNTNNTSLSLDLSGRIYFLKSFVLGFDGSKNINEGYSTSIAANPLIINTYIEKQFFGRRGRLRLQGYDLLNEARSVTASQNQNSYVQSSSNRLTRYFLFSFAYRLNKFAGKTQGDRDFGPGDRREGGFRPGGGPPPMGF
ncbi:outer membrane beta-barrel protein [Arcticibacter sp. MXS-1]|uniref:outer membrane beta-barrel protein n=1 Tax=Arcticibacter sp. MXS-1 TaxID=3341726 RepID=UPI0035A96807